MRWVKGAQGRGLKVGGTFFFAIGFVSARSGPGERGRVPISLCALPSRGVTAHRVSLPPWVTAVRGLPYRPFSPPGSAGDSSRDRSGVYTGAPASFQKHTLRLPPQRLRSGRLGVPHSALDRFERPAPSSGTNTFATAANPVPTQGSGDRSPSP